MVVGIVVALIALLLIGYGLYRLLHFDFDLALDFGDLEYTWTPEPFPNSGTLPRSTRLRRRVVRWHNSDHYWRGSDFWRTFEDGPWKWGQQARFAGKDHNCGHYFALTEAGATAEAAYYGRDPARQRLLAVEVDCQALLDLTYEENLVAVARETFSNWKDIGERHFYVSILSALMDSAAGGNRITDYVGYRAWSDGYDGILYFGARAIEAKPSLKSYIETGADDGSFGPVVHGYFYDMRRDESLQDLVVFSGARLTSTIHVSQLWPDPLDINPYLGADESVLDARLTYDAEYQSTQCKVMYLATPFTIE